MTDKEAIEALGPYVDHLRNGWANAWEYYLSTDEYHHPHLTKSTRASILQNHAVGFCEKSLAASGLRGFKHQENKAELSVDGKALIAFKKLSGKLLPSNNHTPRSRLFYSQSLGVQGVFNLVVGAVISEDWSELLGIYLIQTRNTNHINWYVNITDGVVFSDSINPELPYDVDDDESTGFFDRDDEQGEANDDELSGNE